ncbi:hypothetical protein GCM10007359_16700 [Rothia aerolata]|uniref:Uncharacterized protein n=1 Tax=Rothia aerolata TaxID=1812262 RepID=A0A917MU83_9MICC|nr:hypothetical protein GCM10007359_16700 [Rothia aerolata]
MLGTLNVAGLPLVVFTHVKDLGVCGDFVNGDLINIFVHGFYSFAEVAPSTFPRGRRRGKRVRQGRNGAWGIRGF